MLHGNILANLRTAPVSGNSDLQKSLSWHFYIAIVSYYIIQTGNQNVAI